eukprot:evm.model.scf_1293EXC.2 EVM.evm.TU.scf_1293EXC.2   scf_1293EXC:5249-11437(-)
MMENEEVDGQIDRMVQFIQQEAEEKAREIDDAANEEFNLEKLQLLENEKASIRKEYERKESQAEVAKKISHSKYVNEMRLKVLTAREGAIQEVLATARRDLVGVSESPQYRELLLSLIVQGMKKLGEKKAVVKCRQVDSGVVHGMLGEAKKAYAAKYGETAPDLKQNDKEFLLPPPTAEADDPAFSCSGGVVLTSADGRIVVNNTLDDRLMICFHENLPLLREVLGRLTAQDIMSSKLVRVTPEESAFTVMELLVENGVSGLPVVDSNNRVIGVVSAYDVLALDCTPGQLDKSEGFFPPINKCINEFGGDRSAMWRDFHERRAAIKKARATRVGDSMHETYTVPQTMSLPDVADFIVRKRLHRVFVVDALDKLVGVVSRGDIMRATIKSFRHVMDGPSH